MPSGASKNDSLFRYWGEIVSLDPALSQSGPADIVEPSSAAWSSSTVIIGLTHPFGCLLGIRVEQQKMHIFGTALANS